MKVVSVEVKQVDLPESMLRAMAKQAEAEREKRAKVIHAEGEFSAAQRLVDAAALLATQPMTLQLRYLQTLTEIGVEKNTTIVFPLPMEMMTLFNKLGDAAAEISRRNTDSHDREKKAKRRRLRSAPLPCWVFSLAWYWSVACSLALATPWAGAQDWERTRLRLLNPWKPR